MAQRDNLIVRTAEVIGTAWNRFVKARDADLQRKPEFISGLVRETRYKGKQSQFSDSAQRRAVRNNWYFVGVNKKALDISSSRIDVYNNPSGLEDEGNKAEGHPFLSVLRRPNPYMGYSLMTQWVQWWLELSGEGYYFIEPDLSSSVGGVKGLWPLPSNAMDIEYTDDNKDIKDYLLMLQEWFRIDPNYICYIRYPNPFDFFRGLSPLVAHMLSIDVDLAMKTWNARFFGRDNVMPSSIISLGSGDPNNTIDQGDIDAVKDQLRSEYAAIDRKTVITNANSMAVALLGYNAKDMDFLAGMQWNKEEILWGIGVPPSMVDKNTTEANATVGLKVFKDNMWGIKQLISDELTSQVMKRWYADTLEVRFKDDRIVDRKAELEEATKAESVLTVDEIRENYYQLKALKEGEVPAKYFGQVIKQEADAETQEKQQDFESKQSELGGKDDEEVEKDKSEANPDNARSNGKVQNNVNVKSVAHINGAPKFQKGHLPTVMLKDLTHNKGARTTAQLQEMEANIRENGITTPVWIVCHHDNTLEIIDGKHRVDFAVQFNIEQIPVKVTHEDGTPMDEEFCYKDWLAKIGTNLISSVEFKSISDELDSYMHKAVNSYKKGKIVGMKFLSSILDEETIKSIQSDLDGVEKQEDIATIFDYWRADLSEGFFTVKGVQGQGILGMQVDQVRWGALLMKKAENPNIV